jgi:hypothetical protein
MAIDVHLVIVLVGRMLAQRGIAGCWNMGAPKGQFKKSADDSVAACNSMA